MSTLRTWEQKGGTDTALVKAIAAGAQNLISQGVDRETALDTATAEAMKRMEGIKAAPASPAEISAENAPASPIANRETNAPVNIPTNTAANVETNAAANIPVNTAANAPTSTAQAAPIEGKETNKAVYDTGISASEGGENKNAVVEAVRETFAANLPERIKNQVYKAIEEKYGSFEGLAESIEEKYAREGSLKGLESSFSDGGARVIREIENARAKNAPASPIANINTNVPVNAAEALPVNTPANIPTSTAEAASVNMPASTAEAAPAQEAENLSAGGKLSLKKEKSGSDISYLTDSDAKEYMLTGNEHSRNKKSELVRKGEKAILTSKNETDEFIERALSEKDMHETKAFAKVPERMADDIRNMDGTNVDGFYLELNSSDILHASKHMNESKQNQIPLTIEDIKNLPEYIVNYDDILKVSRQKDGRRIIQIGKKINGRAVVAVIASDGRKSLTPKTFYVLDTEKYNSLYGGKKEDTGKLREAYATQSDALPDTSETVPPTVSSTVTIPQSGEAVNTQNEISGGEFMTEEEIAAVNNFAQIFGTRVVIVESLGGGLNGVYKNGVIYLAKDAAEPGVTVFAHEITHHFEETAPAEYEKYKEIALELAKEENPFTDIVKERIELYRQKGIELNRDEAEMEIAADYTGKILKDAESINEFAKKTEKLAEKERKSLLKRLLDAIRAIINKVKNWNKGRSETAWEGETEKARKAAEALEKIIARSAEENNKVKPTKITEGAESASAAATKTATGFTETAPSENSIRQKDGNVKNSANNSVQSGVYDYSKAFGQQIDDWKAGKIPKRDSLLVGGTPEVFRKIGFNALPVTINQTHVDYAINGVKDADHHLGEAMLKQLPEALKRPVAVIASETRKDTSVVALLPMKLNGNTVVTPVSVDGYGHQNSVRIDSNAVTSVFGKKNAVGTLLNNAISKEAAGEAAVYYIDTKKAAVLLQSAGLQLPGGLFRNSGFIHSIRESGSNVKPKIENVTQSQQFKRWFGDWEKNPNRASKVVNEDGTPKIVYHGTNEEFNVFDTNRFNKREPSGDYVGEGFFFADKSSTARKYGKNVMPVYLDIKKPLVINTVEDAKKFRNSFFGKYKNGDNELRSLIGGDYDYFSIMKENPSDIRQELQRQGYDGLIDNMYGQYAVFNPEQIKSATDNIGTFDGNNPDIRYSVKKNDSKDSRKPARDYEYNGFDEKTIQKIWKRTYDNPDIKTKNDIIADLYSRYKNISDAPEDEYRIMALALEARENGDNFPIEEREYYRIGEPREGYGRYFSSRNFADDRPEAGVSVMTPEWLNSLKSVFYGVSDEKIKNRGIWKIKGVQIAEGGDGEPLILPTGWAERTDYTSVDDWYNDFKDKDTEGKVKYSVKKNDSEGDISAQRLLQNIADELNIQHELVNAAKRSGGEIQKLIDENKSLRKSLDNAKIQQKRTKEIRVNRAEVGKTVRDLLRRMNSYADQKDISDNCMKNSRKLLAF